jgi:peptidoglycan hydrolase FlgJ
MAISPPSDLILDVARAADPQKAAVVTRALVSAASAGVATGEFSAAIKNVTDGSVGRDFSYRSPSPPVHPAIQTTPQKAVVGLESVLLKSFIDQMLPKDAVDVFGSGVAGDVWKSMLSEKIAAEVAKSGTLKIGQRLFETHPDLLQSHRINPPSLALSATPLARKI